MTEIANELEKQAKVLRRQAKSLLEARASLGRGFRGLTDDYLAEANAKEHLADDLEAKARRLREVRFDA